MQREIYTQFLYSFYLPWLRIKQNPNLQIY